MAMWAEGTTTRTNAFDHNTVQTPTLANGIAIYGGRDNTVSSNVVADPIQGSGHVPATRCQAARRGGYLKVHADNRSRADRVGDDVARDLFVPTA